MNTIKAWLLCLNNSFTGGDLFIDAVKEEAKSVVLEGSEFEYRQKNVNKFSDIFGQWDLRCNETSRRKIQFHSVLDKWILSA